MSYRIGANDASGIDDDITAQDVGTTRALHVFSKGGVGGILQGVSYDYIARTETAADTDTFTYKTGGSGGTTVAVVTVVYESSAKEEILTVTRTS